MTTAFPPILTLLCLTQFAAAFPDLLDAGPSQHQLSSTTIPRGSSFTFSTRIDNKGDEDAIDVVVSFRLSQDLIAGNSDDQEIGTVTLPGVGSDSSAAVNATLQMPQFSLQLAPYFLVWQFDIPKDENAADNSGGYTAGQINTNAPPPDFDLATGNPFLESRSRQTLAPGEYFDISHNICNEGPQASAGYTVQYFLSEDGTIGDASDILIGEIGGGSIGAPQRTPTCINIAHRVWVPIDTPDDNYFFGYKISAPGDFDSNNNSKRFEGLITIRRPTGGPDLTDAGPAWWGLPYAYAGITRVFVDSSFEIDAAVMNIGNELSSNFTVRFYASTDGAIGNADDVFLKEVSHGPVLPGILDLVQIGTSLPTDDLLAGEIYRIGWIISSSGESDTTNNSALMTSAIGTRENIDISLAQDGPAGSLSLSGELNTHDDACFRFNMVVHNHSAVPVGVKLRAELVDVDTGTIFYADLNNEMYRFWIDGELQQPYASANASCYGCPQYYPNLAAGEQVRYISEIRRFDIRSTLDQLINRSLPQGTYEVTLFATPLEVVPSEDFAIAYSVLDSNPANNSATLDNSVRIDRKSQPDLQISAGFQGNQTGILPGTVVTVTGTVTNDGVEDAPASTLRISLDGTPLGADRNIPALDKRDSYEFSYTATIPSNQPSGEYEFRVEIDPDNGIAEDAECNNHSSRTLGIGPKPDLREIAGFQSLPIAALPGGTFDFQFRISNVGFDPAGTFKVAFYLHKPSTDGDTDQFLDTLLVAGLTPFEGIEPIIPFSTAVSTAPGPYHIRWEIDSSETVDENNEDNNAGMSTEPIWIGSRANLTVGPTPFSTIRETYEAGEMLVLSGSRKNTGNIGAGPHRDEVRLIPEPTILGDEIVLKTTFISALHSLAGQTRSVSENVGIPVGIPPGHYLLSYVQDSGNTVAETSDDDNRASVSIVVVESTAQPKIFGFEKFGDDIELTWTSRPDRDYRLQRSLDLTSWDAIGVDHQGQGITTQWNYENAALGTGGEAFFRIIELEP